MKPFLLDRRQTNFMPLLGLLMLLLQGAIAICLLVQGVALRQLAQREWAFVQTEAGETFPVRMIDAEARQPAAIRRFVSQTLYLLFNWSGEVPGSDGQRTADLGQTIELDGARVKLPTATLYASYGLAPALQMPLLQQIAALVPAGVFEGSSQALLTLEQVSEPKQIAPGRWEVRVVGQHQIARNGSPLGQAIPFTKRIRVQALPVPVVPAGESALQQAIYTMRASGLQIYAIDELNSGTQSDELTP